MIPADLARALADRYLLDREIGCGGMATVYLADDLKHGRKVAIKVMDPELGAAIGPDRFLREIEIAARLTHPHILPLFDSGAAEGQLYYVMPYIEGASLRARLDLDKQLALEDALRLAREIASALNHAHHHGLIHRDIKPENVLLADGIALVADFGIARATRGNRLGSTTSPTLAPATTAGAVMGTPRYMSPEQATGAEVDGRTDLYALGCVLYEMLAGVPPFLAANDAVLIRLHLTTAPRDITEHRPNVPPGVAAAINRALAKLPADRFAGMAQFAEALAVGASGGPTPTPVAGPGRALESGSVSPEAPTVPGFGGRPAIAVMPFENRSGDPEQEYFADGLAEDLITRLALWRSFPVIARQSSFAYKGKSSDLKQVSAELGVRYLVQGSVRKSGDRVRIAAQLVDAATGQNVWAQTYDRVLTDVFAVQDEISEAIAASLVVDLNRAEHALVTGSTLVSLAHVHVQHHADLEAWGLYQRALAFFYRFTREDFAQARALLERAVELDPQFSTAWARLAETGMWEVIYGWTENPDQTIERALAQARRAVTLDPRDAEAHAELAFVLMTAGEGYAAIEEARRGTELNPSHPWALLIRAYVWHMTGNPPEESIQLVLRAMRLSPRDPAEWLFYDVLGGAYFNAGRFDEGLAAGRRLVSLWPGYYFGHLWCAMNSMELGQTESAEASIREARRVLPELTLAMARRVLGAMAPDVDRRMMGALQRAGLQ